VSLLLNDWQHTLSFRTRSGVGTNFTHILLKYEDRINNLPIKQNARKSQPIKKPDVKRR
jgi:hypothetical protein